MKGFLTTFGMTTTEPERSGCHSERSEETPKKYNNEYIRNNKTRKPGV